jgi:diguanylate cyclase (GGDEF)-like protein
MTVQILVVDDSDDSRLLFESILKRAGVGEIVVADTAETALARLKNEEPLRTDLVLMDLSLPGMDGVAATRAIRDDGRMQDIPVVMITAHADVTYLEAAFEAGATDFVSKSANKVELLQRIRAALRLKHETDRRKVRERELVDTQQQLTEANESLRLLAGVDALTRLPNRRTFDAALTDELLRAKREQTALSLLIVDVDYFKAFNDCYGHSAGDECLRRVGAAIEAQVNRPADLAARYGGEEFAVLLPSTGPLGARHVAEAIRASVEASQIPHRGSAIGACVTLSVGLATARSGDTPGSVLIEAADKALYRAKANGRNRIEME